MKIWLFFAASLKKVESDIHAYFLEFVGHQYANSSGLLEARGPFITKKIGKQSVKAVITIKDNGKGIPQSILTKLGEWEATFGKENSKGLGLHYAKSELEEIGGK